MVGFTAQNHYGWGAMVQKSIFLRARREQGRQCEKRQVNESHPGCELELRMRLRGGNAEGEQTIFWGGVHDVAAFLWPSATRTTQACLL